MAEQTECQNCGQAIWYQKTSPNSTLGSWYTGTSGSASAVCPKATRSFGPHKVASR